MPELPEVETICRGIAPHIINRRIKQIIIRQPKLRWPVPNALGDILCGLSIQSVSRRAKYLLLTTSAGTIILHLGMSGSLRILPANLASGKHDHVDFVFEDQSLLRFNDPRRFGALLWTDQPITEHRLFKDLGPEPLLPEFSGDLLYALAKNRKTSVKSFIMNSHVVVGVGNIYANEALFMAGILPTRNACDISLEHYQKLAESIRVILQLAINQGGTTLKDFVNEAGKPGYFQQQLKVYGHSGLPCSHCHRPLTQIRISNRSTVFCENCQQ